MKSKRKKLHVKKPKRGKELFIKNLIKTNNFYHFLFNLIFIYRKGLYTPQLIYDITSN